MKREGIPRTESFAVYGPYLERVQQNEKFETFVSVYDFTEQWNEWQPPKELKTVCVYVPQTFGSMHTMFMKLPSTVKRLGFVLPAMTKSQTGQTLSFPTDLQSLCIDVGFVTKVQPQLQDWMRIPDFKKHKELKTLEVVFHITHQNLEFQNVVRTHLIERSKVPKITNIVYHVSFYGTLSKKFEVQETIEVMANENLRKQIWSKPPSMTINLRHYMDSNFGKNIWAIRRGLASVGNQSYTIDYEVVF